MSYSQPISTNLVSFDGEIIYLRHHTQDTPPPSTNRMLRAPELAKTFGRTRSDGPIAELTYIEVNREISKINYSRAKTHYECEELSNLVSLPPKTATICL